MDYKIQALLFVFILMACSPYRYQLSGELQSEYFAARFSYELGDYQKAQSLFTDLAVKAEKVLPVQLQLAKTQIMLKQYHAAEEQLQKIITGDSRYYEAMFWYGRLCLLQGKYLQAEQKFRNLIMLNSSASEAYYYLAIIYSKEDFTPNNLALSLQYIKQANKLSKEQLAYQLHEEARLYMTLQNFNKSRELILDSLTLLNKDQPLYAANQAILLALEETDEEN